MDNPSAGMNAGGGPARADQGGFDSGGNSFETEISEVHEIYSTQPPINTGDEIPEDNGSRIMEIPGTAHDKLSGLAEMEDEMDDEPEKTDKKANTPENHLKDELSLEQKVISLQAEALNHLAKSMNERRNNNEEEDLLRKLKELLEEIEKNGGNNKVSLIGAVAGVLMVLISSSEKGVKQLEREVKRAQ